MKSGGSRGESDSVWHVYKGRHRIFKTFHCGTPSDRITFENLNDGFDISVVNPLTAIGEPCFSERFAPMQSKLG